MKLSEYAPVTPVQIGVNIFLGFLQCPPAELSDATTWFCQTQLRDLKYPEDDIERLLDPEQHEKMEDTPIYDEYYRLHNVFYKRVVQALTAIL